MPLSDECASEIHEFCGPCDCKCHGYTFTLEEVRTLYKLLEYQYIDHYNPMNHPTVDKLYKIVKEAKS